ncbi:MAG: hypothetical protein OXP75_09655, partial [Rhodospirillales bacterium]|nr:hypothetical protein [Rhodospirillales bacterium]
RADEIKARAKRRALAAYQIQVARASIFAAQAIALDMIAAGRQKRVDQLLEHAAIVVPGVAPDPIVDEAATSETRDSSRGNS